SAIDRLRRALDETLVGGVQTDLGFHRWLVDHPAFVAGDYHTGLIAAAWGESGPALDPQVAALAALAAREGRLRQPAASARPAADATGGTGVSPWSRLARREGLRR
ncbi:MAG: hypothetical protein ACRDHD_09455, partial [Candidatus Limnocylindria bacterium]